MACLEDENMGIPEFPNHSWGTAPSLAFHYPVPDQADVPVAPTIPGLPCALEQVDVCYCFS